MSIIMSIVAAIDTHLRSQVNFNVYNNNNWRALVGRDKPQYIYSQRQQRKQKQNISHPCSFVHMLVIVCIESTRVFSPVGRY